MLSLLVNVILDLLISLHVTFKQVRNVTFDLLKVFKIYNHSGKRLSMGGLLCLEVQRLCQRSKIEELISKSI